MTAHTPSYVYQPLTEPSKQLRLLKFQHSWASKPPSQIALITLATFNIEGAPIFAALSYTWGTPDYDCHCLMNGHALNITPNCAHALQQLHRYDRQRDGWYWIDAICINQRDMDEKKYQVAMMAQLYSSAREVIISLSEETSLGKLAFHDRHQLLWHSPQSSTSERQVDALSQEAERFGLHLELSEICHAAMSNNAARREVDWWISVVEQYLDSGETSQIEETTRPHTEIRWEPTTQEDILLSTNEGCCSNVWTRRFCLQKWLIRVALHEYWNRRWIVQEISLATSITLLDGHLACPLCCVIRIMHVFGLVLRDEQPPISTACQLEVDALPKSSMIQLCDWLRIMDKSDGSETSHMPTRSMIEALCACDVKCCRDPRDRVYSLLSIVKWTSETPQIEADYCASMLQLARSIFSASRREIPAGLPWHLLAVDILALLECHELNHDIKEASRQRQARYRSSNEDEPLPPSQLLYRTTGCADRHVSQVVKDNFKLSGYGLTTLLF